MGYELSDRVIEDRPAFEIEIVRLTPLRFDSSNDIPYEDFMGRERQLYPARVPTRTG
jgi:hypothetical protein